MHFDDWLKKKKRYEDTVWQTVKPGFHHNKMFCLVNICAQEEFSSRRKKCVD